MLQNQFEFTGKVCKDDGQVKVYDKGGKVVYVGKLSIVKKKGKDTDDYEYFDFTFFGEELCEKIASVKKGDTVNIIGRIKQDSYTSKSGDKVNTYTLVGTDIKRAIYDADAKEYIEYVKDGGLDF